MSEQSKTSPGPWKYDESSGAISDSQGRIALLYARDGVQVMHANGQLMAAAWEMREELEQLQSLLGRTHSGVLEAEERIQQMSKENARLRAALKPFAVFADKWDAAPLRGVDDILYAIHSEEKHGEIRLSDCKAARAALAKAGR